LIFFIMLKKAFLVLSIFALAACSDGVYDEIDQQIEDGELPMSTSSFEDSDPGWINFPGGGGAPFINPGDGYQSPWDIWFRNKPYTPSYTFSNRGGGGHTSPLRIQIRPWAGLAYFDGTNDGFYNDDYLLLNNPPGMVADFTTGGYPNLYAGNNEVGNLIPGAFIVLDGTTMAQSELELGSDPASGNPEHLLSPAGFPNPMGYNPNNISFRFPGLNPAERNLMAQYGRIFYFEVDIFEQATGAFIGKFFLQVYNGSVDGSSPIPYWIPAGGIQANVPG